MSQAKIKVQNLPDAPKPTKAVRAKDPREIERAQRISEHNKISFDHKPKHVMYFWDEARLSRLRRLWEEGYSAKYIARECGCDVDKCLKRISYEITNGRIEKRKTMLTAEEKAKIYKLYKLGMSSAQIAKEFKVHKNSISRIVKKMRDKENQK